MDWETQWLEVKTAFQSPPANAKYKRCNHNIVELQSTSSTKTNESRSNVKDSRFAKFRASELMPTRIYDTDQKKFVHQINHRWTSYDKGDQVSIIYRVGAIAIPSGFDRNLEVVCSRGIHYFQSLLAAFLYDYQPPVSFNDCGELTLIQSSELCNLKKTIVFDQDYNKMLGVNWLMEHYQLKDVVFADEWFLVRQERANK